jgi:ArsR family transcriptional regulator
MSNYSEHARVFRAFCDENRLMILEMLRSGEKCACILLETMDISQPTLSHHMKILCDSGIVASRRTGKWTHYSINGEGSARAGELLLALTAVKECCDMRCCE